MNADNDYGPYGAVEGSSFATSYLMHEPFQADFLNKKSQETVGFHWSNELSPFPKMAFQVSSTVVDYPATRNKFLFGVTMVGQSMQKVWSKKLTQGSSYLEALKLVPKVLQKQGYDPTMGFATMECIDYYNNAHITETESWTIENDYIHRTILDQDYQHPLNKAVSMTNSRCKEVSGHCLEVLNKKDVEEIWQQCYGSSSGTPDTEFSNIAQALTADLLTYREFYGDLFHKIFESNENTD